MPKTGQKAASFPFKLHHGNCKDVLLTFKPESIDSVVTDPPYELGFMGKSWDSTGIAYDVEMWRYVLRALKPGGHLLAFSGSRTYHRMACAIEDAGFEIRDCLMWVYGSGFPKSHNVSKGIDKMYGHEREKIRYEQGNSAGSANTVGGSNRSGAKGESRPWIEEAKRKGFHEADGDTPISEEAELWNGFGSALKPSLEPICLAMRPLIGPIQRNIRKYGTGGLNIDGCRIGTEGGTKRNEQTPVGPSGWRTGGEIGVLNKGRWPANFCHDGSEEVVSLFPTTKKGSASGYNLDQSNNDNVTHITNNIKSGVHFGDSGSAARFFYCSKASRRDRDEGLEDLALQNVGSLAGSADGTLNGGLIPQGRNIHTTVKPTSLMQWLCRLITPPGGTILDPFTGSGSTGKAAGLEGFKFEGIEMSEEYIEIAKRRILFGYQNRKK